MSYTVSKCTPEAARFVAERLREEDRIEVLASSGVAPEAILPFYPQTPGHHFVASTPDGRPAVIFGASPDAPGSPLGIVYMLSTADLFAHLREFVRATPEWLDRLHRVYPLLGNYVDARNTVHVRWLRRMGFSFLRECPGYGVGGETFLQFAKLKDTRPCVD